MTSALSGALARLPEYRRLADALARVRAQQGAPQPQPDEVPGPVESDRVVAEAAVEAVLAGGEVDQVLVARYATATATPARPVHVVQQELLRGVVERLRPQMEAMVRSHADELLGFLAEDLEVLLAEVRGQAAAGDRHVSEYGDLRAAQREITEARLGQTQRTVSLICDVGLLENMPEIHPALLERLHPRRPGSMAAEWPPSSRQRILSSSSSWPWPADARDVWPTDDRVAFLTWLAKDPLPCPWLPTTVALVEAGRRLADRVSAARRAVGIPENMMTVTPGR